MYLSEEELYRTVEYTFYAHYTFSDGLGFQDT
jgi:hypothetical protein